MFPVRLVIFVFLLALVFSSCTSVSYTEAPPNDVPALNAFPPAMQGKYYISSTKDVKGNPLKPADLAFTKKFSLFDIYPDSLVFHDYRTESFKMKPIDTSVVAVNDSLISIRNNGEVGAYPYMTFAGEYVAITKTNNMTIVLCDTIKLKQAGEYYFLSIGLEKAKFWGCFVIGQKPGGIFQWYTTNAYKNQQKLEDKLKTITPLVPGEMNGKPLNSINVDQKTMMQLIKQGIYQPEIDFKRVP